MIIKLSAFHKISTKSTSFCLTMSLFLFISLAIASKRLYDRYSNNKILSQELAANIFKLSDRRKRITIAKEREKLSQQQTQAEIEQLEKYYNDVPLVVSTSDGKGRLVGFSRLGMPNGAAQYSFLATNSNGLITISGTITNQSNKLVYSDDYSTPSEYRTSGEIAHSKPNPSKLRIDFVVTSSSSDRFRIGDTFFAEFNLPSSNGNSI